MKPDHDKEPPTIALLGANIVVGHALLLLLRGAGYDVRILDAPTGMPKELLEVADLLLISPGLTNGRREESLTALGGTRERIGVPVLELSPVIKEGLIDDEVRAMQWPINIDGLIREIEGALEGALQGVQAEMETVGEPPVGEQPAGSSAFGRC